MDEINGHSIDCAMRHQQLQETSKILKDLHRVIIGDLENPEELGLNAKMNLLFKDYEDKKVRLERIVITVISSLIMLIFWCGYQYRVLCSHTEKLESLETIMVEFIQQNTQKGV